MTTIHAEQLLRMIAWTPGRFAIGELYPEIDIVSILGSVNTTQTAWRTMWPADALYTFSAAPANMYVSSSSTADVGRVIIVGGLDGQFNQVVGYGITNGQNQSIITSLPGAGSPVSFFRVNQAQDVTPSLSPGNVAAGTIYVAELTTPVEGVPPVVDTRCILPVGESSRNGVIYTVPAGYILVSRTFIFSQDGSQQVLVRYTLSPHQVVGPTILYLPTVTFPLVATVAGVTTVDLSPSVFVAPSRTDITFEAQGTAPVSGNASLVIASTLIDERYVKNLRVGAQLGVF